MFQTDFKAVEKDVSERAGNYSGLDPEALLTSEEDFRRIFSSLPDLEIWVELGSGHGLGPLLFSYLYPEKKSIGIEFERPRFEASIELKEKHELTNVNFIHGDLLHCEIPAGDAYFFYFPTGPVLDRILHELGSREGALKIIAIESHGDFLGRLNKESWLKEVMEIPLTSPRHCNVARVFEKISKKEASLHDYSFQKKFLFIHNDSSEWIGESFGLEWLKDDEYQCVIPPRSFKQSEVRTILDLEGIDKRFHPALLLRPLGNLKIVTETRELLGQLRKIYVAPCFKVEISSGEQVEWEKIRQIYWENNLCFDSSLDYFFYPHVV